MPRDFKIRFDNQVFSVATPVPPENEFVKYRPAIPLNDDRVFGNSRSVVGLGVHWKYRSGIIRQVAGVMEMTVMLRAISEYDTSSEDGLKQQLLEYFKLVLAPVGYKGTPIPFEKVTINGRSWLKYKVPVLGSIEYSTRLSNNRLLTAKFAFIDNTGEKSPAWFQEANAQMKQLVDSMRLQ